MRWLRIKQRQNPVQHRTDDSNEDVPQAPCLSTPRSKTHTQLQNVRHLISPGAKKSLLFHNVMVDQLAKSTEKAGASQKRPAVTPNILKKYRLQNFARKIGLPRATRVRGQSDGGHANALDTTTKELVEQYFERDDISRLTSGKNER